MKKLALLITILLVTTSVLTAGCGRVYTNTNPGPLPRAVPHAVDFRFSNCNVCHVADQLAVKNVPHDNFTNDMCDQDGCHGPLVYKTKSTSPIARPIPHIVTAPLDNCVACHDPAKTGTVIPHSMYKDNTLCLTPACHKVGPPVTTPPVTTPPASTTAPTTPTTPTTPAGTTPPGGTTTTPPASTTTPPAGTTTPPASTAGGPPVLTLAALPLDAPTHPAAYKDLCMMCHAAGMGAQQYPLPPTWAGTPKTPGSFTVTPGSDQDHTGRTTTADCVKSGCHKAPW